MRFLFLPWLSPVLSPWLYKPRTGDNLRGVVSFWISGIELLPWLSPVLSPRLYRSRGREIIRGVVASVHIHVHSVPYYTLLSSSRTLLYYGTRSVSVIGCVSM